MEATLSSKGQATIPKAVRERLHLKPGDRGFKFFFHPDGVIIQPKIPTSRLKGIIPKPARRVSTVSPIRSSQTLSQSGSGTRLRSRRVGT